MGKLGRQGGERQERCLYGDCRARFQPQGSTGAASTKSCQRLPICQMEPMPSGSEKDLELTKAGPISHGGSASRIMYLRGQKACPSSNYTRAVGKTLVSPAVPLQPMDVHDGTENPLQPVEHPTLEHRDTQRRL